MEITTTKGKSNYPKLDNFRGKYINYYTYTGETFVECDFSHVDAKSTTFEGCKFKNCSFDNGNFQFARFSNCSFSQSRPQAKIRNASFGGCQFSGCEMFLGTSVWFHETSLRDARVENCKIGNVSINESSVEFATIAGCDIESLDISFASCTGLIFSNCNLHSIVFSIANFLLVIGAWNFFYAQNKTLRHTIDANKTEDISDNEEILRQIETQLKEDLKNGKSAWKIASSTATIAILGGGNLSDSFDKITSKLGEILASADMEEERALDEVVLILKLLHEIKLFNRKLLALCLEVKKILAGCKDKLHPLLWQSLTQQLESYQSVVEKKFLVKLHFSGLDFLDPNDAKLAASLVSSINKLVTDKASNNALKMYRGSLAIEIIEIIENLEWWLAILYLLAIKTKLSLDFNRFIDQIGAAVKYIKRDKVKELRALRRRSRKIDLSVQIKALDADGESTLDDIELLVVIKNKNLLDGKNSRRGALQKDQDEK